jgi:hypothetical protein
LSLGFGILSDKLAVCTKFELAGFLVIFIPENPPLTHIIHHILPIIFPMILVILISSGQYSFSQGIPGSGGEDPLGDKNFDFVPLPYINYSRSLGFSGGLIPMAMYRVNPNDTISPPSISGIMGMYTTNDTWFAMYFTRLFLDKDHWRVTTAGGLGSVNFQFYLDARVSGFIGYNTQADFFFIEVQRKVKGKLYAGLNYLYTQFDTSFGEDSIVNLEEVRLHGIGLVSTMDKRDNVYYAMDGFLAELKLTSYPGSLGNDFESNKIELSFNKYLNIREQQDVIATRLYTGIGMGDLSFQQQFIVGQEDIRGYSEGKFRGDYLVAAQGEYRWNFHKKMSAVGFFGIATIFGSINESDEGKILPGIGTGFRYNVFPKYHMNVGIDVAAGKDDWGFYFRIGEAF